MNNAGVTIQLGNQNQINLTGQLTREQSEQFTQGLQQLAYAPEGALIMNIEQVADLDTVGAWQIQQFIQQRQKQGQVVTLVGVQEQFRSLFKLVEDNTNVVLHPEPTPDTWFTFMGKESCRGYEQLYAYFFFIGELWQEFMQWIKRPKLIRWRAIMAQIQLDGANAFPIVALLSFLIGVVLAYQIGIQLKLYGANIYIVDLMGMAVLREFGPLITAIILVARTGSAYTAQIGTMQLNEEIDALKTFGLSPNSLIVLPKVLALTLSLPLLTVLSEIFGIFGGMLMAKFMLSITFSDFLSRFSTEIVLSTYVVGLIKTPVFALIIASIGCFQGYRVSNSAASVGERTTVSVVQGIFMIVVADAAFSICYTALGL